MNQKLLKQLLEKSDFVFWEDRDEIDWSSDYSEEVKMLVRLTVQEVIDLCYQEWDRVRATQPMSSNDTFVDHGKAIQCLQIAQVVKTHFGV